MAPRSKLDRAEPVAADKTGLPVLAPREREVALALAEGLSRAHVAERMRLSVHTEIGPDCAACLNSQGVRADFAPRSASANACPIGARIFAAPR